MGFRNFRDMKNLILLLSMVVFFAGCEKDKTAPNVPPVTTETPMEAKKRLLTDARWKLEKMETRVLVGSDTMQFDITTNVQCELDNEMEYHASGYIKVHAGALLCYGGEPAVDTFETWTLVNEQQVLETNLTDGFNAYWDIEQLDEHTLRVATGQVDNNGNQRNIMTYKNVKP